MEFLGICETFSVRKKAYDDDADVDETYVDVETYTFLPVFPDGSNNTQHTSNII
jgi:hypothetical protein